MKEFNMEDDLEKLDFYKSAQFYFDNKFLFSNIVKSPDKDYLKELKGKSKKIEIERFYNHFHMTAITYDMDRQRKIAGELWKIWRDFFSSDNVFKKVVIEIQDYPQEVIIYVYQQEEFGPAGL